MRRIAILFFVSLLLCSSAYAGERSSGGPVVLAESRAGNVKAVLYMTTW